MKIISNNLIGKMPIPEDAIIRVNLAWVKDYKTAFDLISSIKYPVYLDYPSGRTKPPTPNITLDEAIELSNRDNVRYFAISNAEDIETLKAIQSRIEVELVPKIETELGVKNIPKMIKINIKTIMLDKEDLYINVKMDSRKFNKLVNKVRHCGIKVLELRGVIFS